MLRSTYEIFVKFITTPKCLTWKNYFKLHPNLWTEMHPRFYNPKTFLFYPAMLWWNLFPETHFVQMKWIFLKEWSTRFNRKFIFDYIGSIEDIPASDSRCRVSRRLSQHSFHNAWQWNFRNWKHFLNNTLNLG